MKNSRKSIRVSKALLLLAAMAWVGIIGLVLVTGLKAAMFDTDSAIMIFIYKAIWFGCLAAASIAVLMLIVRRLKN